MNQERKHQELEEEYEKNIKELVDSLEEYKNIQVDQDLEAEFSAERTAFMTQVDTLKTLNDDLTQNSNNQLGENVHLQKQVADKVRELMELTFDYNQLSISHQKELDDLKTKVDDVNIENMDIREMNAKHLHEKNQGENEIKNLKTINDNLTVQVD